MFVPVFHMDMICVPTPILKTDENDGLELITGFLFWSDWNLRVKKKQN